MYKIDNFVKMNKWGTIEPGNLCLVIMVDIKFILSSGVDSCRPNIYHRSLNLLTFQNEISPFPKAGESYLLLSNKPIKLKV